MVDYKDKDESMHVWMYVYVFIYVCMYVCVYVAVSACDDVAGFLCGMRLSDKMGLMEII